MKKYTRNNDKQMSRARRVIQYFYRKFRTLIYHKGDNRFKRREERSKLRLEVREYHGAQYQRDKQRSKDKQIARRRRNRKQARAMHQVERRQA